MAVNFSSESGTRNGMIWPVEGDHVYMVALSGYKGDHPPTTEKEFLDFAQSLGVRCCIDWRNAGKKPYVRTLS